MTVSADAKQNHLLAALPEPEWRRWSAELDLVEMPLGDVLYESDVTLSHVYFPTTAIVSLLYVMQNGSSAEIAVIGNEGLVASRCFRAANRRPAGPRCLSAHRSVRIRTRAE